MLDSVQSANGSGVLPLLVSPSRYACPLPALRFRPRSLPRVAASGRRNPRRTFRSDSSLVVIPTHVTTAAGSSVTSLTKENFRVIEDNVEQPIVHFDKDDAPVSIGLLFDKSGSMRDKMQKAAEAVTAFFKTANAEDEFFLVEFSDRAETRGPFTPDSGLCSSGSLAPSHSE